MTFVTWLEVARRTWCAGVAALLMVCAPAYAAIEPAFYFGGHDMTTITTWSIQVENAMRRISAAANDDDRKAALAAAQELADSGDAEAAFRLGRYYHLESRNPDYAQALNLYTRAMAKGNAWAINNIGLLYRDGRGVPRDYAKAREYFEKAAEQHSPYGFYNMALMSFEGRSVPRDVQSGLGWLERCGDLHLALCLYEEAALYYTGDYGVSKDAAKTLALGTRASQLGDRAAAWGIAKMYLLGEGTSEDVAKGMAQMNSLSENGYPKATGSLGELYADPKIRNEFFDGKFDGENVVPDAFTSAVHSDIAKAIGYWEAAAKQGNCHSLADLSSIYDRGAGVPLNYATGARYVAQAVRCAPTNSFYLWKLGDRLTEAKGLPRDCVMASKVFLASMALGSSDAALSLGYIFDKGCDSILHDDRRAFQIYLLCAKAGLPMCQNNVGAMLKHGRGVGAPDTVRAYAWLTLAASNGSELAVSNLANNTDLFPEDVQRRGLEHLQDVKKMIDKGVMNTQLLVSGDMTY